MIHDLVNAAANQAWKLFAIVIGVAAGLLVLAFFIGRWTK